MTEPVAVAAASREPVREADWREVLELLADARRLRDQLAPTADARAAFDRRLRDAAAVVGPLVAEVYLPLIAATALGPLTIAQAGQSVDGRVATAHGRTTVINGGDALDHLHRLRALVDAVVVGASTVATDDPLLTTRRVSGDSPVRVVIDPRRRLAASFRVFTGTPPTVIVCRHGEQRAAAGEATAIIGIAASAERPLPARLIIAALRRRGLKSLLIEGGPTTLSLFLAAGEIDRLHVLIAPMIIGSGPPSVNLPAYAGLHEAMHFDGAVWRLGDDVLFDLTPRPRLPPLTIRQTRRRDPP